jgi:hypothetical protein
MEPDDEQDDDRDVEAELHEADEPAEEDDRELGVLVDGLAVGVAAVEAVLDDRGGDRDGRDRDERVEEPAERSGGPTRRRVGRSCVRDRRGSRSPLLVLHAPWIPGSAERETSRS